MTCKWCDADLPLHVVCGVPLHDVHGLLTPCEDMPASHYAVSEPLAYPVRITDADTPHFGGRRQWKIFYSDGTTEITDKIERVRALVPERQRNNWR